MTPHKAKGVICVLTSAVLYVLVFPNFNFSFLAWVAFIPLVFSIQSQSSKQAFLYGWLSGTLAYMGILYWIIPTFHAAQVSLGLAFAALLALSAYVGLFWGAWAYFGVKIQHQKFRFDLEPWSPLFGAAAWVALEYLRTFLFSGFPWTLLGDSQISHLALIQMASVTGVYGVSFLVVMVNLTFCVALKRTPKKRALLVPLLILTGAYLFGQSQLTQQFHKDDGKQLKVALLQGNIDQYKKWNEAYIEEIKQTYSILVQRASAAQVDLIIWPETSVPGYLTQDPALWIWLTGVIIKSHTSHLLGAPSAEGSKAFNAAFSISRFGLIQGSYAKQHLVPFGEIVPFQNLLGQWIPVLNALGGFNAGTVSPVLSAAGIPVGINICYEAIFPDLVRRSVKAGGQAIVNITNDGWYMKTAAPYQHLAPNIFRAIENRRWVLRADNTGVSALIDPTGHIIAQTPIYQARLLTGTIYARTEQTFYTKYGDLFSWICLAIVSAWVFCRRTL